jgi:hypothetical protein
MRPADNRLLSVCGTVLEDEMSLNRLAACLFISDGVIIGLVFASSLTKGSSPMAEAEASRGGGSILPSILKISRTLNQRVNRLVIVCVIDFLFLVHKVKVLLVTV